MILIICKDLKEIQSSNKVNHQKKFREIKMKMGIEMLKVKSNKISLFMILKIIQQMILSLLISNKIKRFRKIKIYKRLIK